MTNHSMPRFKKYLGLALLCCILGTASMAQAAENCSKTYPNPLIKLDHKDDQGRVFFTVLNWTSYAPELFRKAPDLPACGANRESARTWVDIFNAGTDAKIYGFCALSAPQDLRSLWFKPGAADTRIYIVLNDRACKKQYRSNVISTAGDDCLRLIPKPMIRYERTDEQGRVYIPVANWSIFPQELFRPAPDLPPCGANANAARTWVDIYDAQTNAKLYGFCALKNSEDLKGIWFKPAQPNGKVYIILNDRACQRTYKSNTITFGECAAIYPKPVIQYDHKDSAGRVFIPVSNWSIYSSELFRPAPELPPCGANANAARTWVDIYDADTNTKIYGFCALKNNADLKGIWFKPEKPTGKVYIILHDRACQKTYKSNTTIWR